MTKRKSIEQVKADFKETWGDRYDYSMITEYTNNKMKLPIICRSHGVFYQSGLEHHRGHGCPLCANQKTSDRCRMPLEEFLEKAEFIHGDKYDYSLITKENFLGSHFKIEIICKEHGIFRQTAHEHLSGRGCYKCGKKSMAVTQAYTIDELIKKFADIFCNKYDYSLFTEYKCKSDKIKVICPKHGVFNVSVNNHLYRKSGCPKCKRSFGEEKVAKYLKENKIDFIEQYPVPNEFVFCKNKKIFVDFYLPTKNVIIEYNGIQHYKDILMFNAITFDEQKMRDEAVRIYCKEHKIKLIIIPYNEYKNIDKVLRQNIRL